MRRKRCGARAAREVGRFCPCLITEAISMVGPGGDRDGSRVIRLNREKRTDGCHAPIKSFADRF